MSVVDPILSKLKIGSCRYVSVKSNITDVQGWIHTKDSIYACIGLSGAWGGIYANISGIRFIRDNVPNCLLLLTAGREFGGAWPYDTKYTCFAAVGLQGRGGRLPSLLSLALPAGAS